LTVLTLHSCTEVIEIELDSTYRRLVVYGTVSSDSIRHEVTLATTSDYFSNQPLPKVPDATVELEFNGQSIRLEPVDTVPGLYRSPAAFRGKPGITYNLHISAVDVDEDGITGEYSASSTMPEFPMLDSIDLAYFNSPFVSGYQVFMYAMDPPARNYYGFRLIRNDTLLTKRLFDYTVQPDDFFNGTYIYGLPVGFIADDEPGGPARPGDTVTFELNQIDRAYYDFVIDAQLEILGNNPLFSGPPANIRTNIDNGGTGIFAAYAIRRVSSVIPTP
ncbi:MAG: DUF4249 domain-containing protein, partial [Bacteroidetes bacterium]